MAAGKEPQNDDYGLKKIAEDPNSGIPDYHSRMDTAEEMRNQNTELRENNDTQIVDAALAQKGFNQAEIGAHLDTSPDDKIAAYKAEILKK